MVKKTTKICPKCGSTDISSSNPSKTTLRGEVLDSMMFVCSDCGHTSQIFPEVNLDEVESIRKEILLNSDGKPDVTGLKVFKPWYKKVGGIFAIIFILFLLYTVIFVAISNLR